LIQGNPTNLQITASTGGYLNTWIDYNQNGSWNEADEHVFIDASLIAGQNNLTLNVPSDAIVGTTIARFRFSLARGLDFAGEADDGEVEDYLVEIDDDAESEIRGVKWNDLNGNGIREAGEPGLANWQIIIDSDLDGLFDPSVDLIAVTNAFGEYSLLGSFNGTYPVTEIDQPGWKQSFPQPDSAGIDYHIVSITTGSIVTDIDFGNIYEGDDRGTKHGQPVRQEKGTATGEAGDGARGGCRAGGASARPAAQRDRPARPVYFL